MNGNFKNMSSDEYNQMRDKISDTRKKRKQLIAYEKFRNKFEDTNGFAFDKVISNIDKLLNMLR